MKQYFTVGHVLEMLAGPFATAAAQLKHAESGRLNARGVA
jgi:hypothetical protein